MSTLKNMKREVAKILLDIKAVTLRPKQPYTYASGIKSPIYCDNRLLISYPEKREIIVQALVTALKGKEFDVLAGIATSGIPWCAWLAKELNKPMIYIRSKGKEHGNENLIEGRINNRQKVIIVEDLISTGGSSIAAVNAVKEAGGIVNDCIAIFTYELESAINKFKKVNCNLLTLTDLKTLVEIAAERNYINPEEKSLVLAWRDNPENWTVKESII